MVPVRTSISVNGASSSDSSSATHTFSNAEFAVISGDVPSVSRPVATSRLNRYVPAGPIFLMNTSAGSPATLNCGLGDGAVGPWSAHALRANIDATTSNVGRFMRKFICGSGWEEMDERSRATFAIQRPIQFVLLHHNL